MRSNEMALLYGEAISERARHLSHAGAFVLDFLVPCALGGIERHTILCTFLGPSAIAIHSFLDKCVKSVQMHVSFTFAPPC
jgi:hypothetical protein